MAYDNETARGSTFFPDLTLAFKERAGGTIAKHRLVTIASDGDVEQATANATGVCGVLHSNYNGKLDAIAGDLVSVGVGRQTVVADVAVLAGQSIKAGSGGKVIPFLDSELSGDTIEDNVGVAFTNQPANDGVEVVSDNAGDTTQTVTIYYTRDSLGDTVNVETKTLNGTTQVAFTHTDISLVLAVEKSAATTGTVTFREASGNATIATLAAATLSAGKIAVTAGQTLAYNVAPTAVADAATTKQVGLIGTDSAGAVQYDSQALTGATPVTFNSAFQTVTFLLVGDLEVARTVTVKVGAEDNQRLYAGYVLEAGAAGALVDAFIDPVRISAGDASLLDGVTAGVVTASKAVVVDASKNIGDFGIITADQVKAPTTGNLLLNSPGAGKSVRLNSATSTDTANSIIGFQSKPAAGASTAQNVIGGEISPRLNDTFALTGSGTIIGLHVDAYLRGTTGNVAGDVRGQQIELVTDDAGTRTITGDVIGLRFRAAFSGTITGNMIAISVEKAEAQTNSKQWEYVFELTGDNALVWRDDYTTEATTQAGAIKVLVNGAERWIALYSGAPVV